MEKGSVSIEVLGTGCPNCQMLEAVARSPPVPKGRDRHRSRVERCRAGQ